MNCTWTEEGCQSFHLYQLVDYCLYLPSCICTLIAHFLASCNCWMFSPTVLVSWQPPQLWVIRVPNCSWNGFLPSRSIRSTLSPTLPADSGQLFPQPYLKVDCFPNCTCMLIIHDFIPSTISVIQKLHNSNCICGLTISPGLPARLPQMC